MFEYLSRVRKNATATALIANFHAKKKVTSNRNNDHLKSCIQNERYIIEEKIIFHLMNQSVLEKITQQQQKQPPFPFYHSILSTNNHRYIFIWPFSLTRFHRASTCLHLQCFDASLFLQMNERKPTWNCPVCDKPAIYETLVIDGYVTIDIDILCICHGVAIQFLMIYYLFNLVDAHFSYFQDVLSSPLLPPDTNEIQLLKDGSWTTHDSNSEPNCLDTPRKATQKVEVISDDIGINIRSICCVRIS